MLTLVAESPPMAFDHEGEKFGEGPHRRVTDRRGSLETRIAALERDVAALQVAPTDVAKLSFSTKVVASIVTSSLFIALALWSVRAEMVSNAALTAERMNTLRDTISMMDKKQELQRLEIQGLKEMILKQGVPR